MFSATSSLGLYMVIALGGALGACLRYFISQMALQWFGKGFPFGTLAVNILGSCLLGIVYGLIESEYVAGHPWRTFLSIGFIGALTTFSTFSLDTLLLMQQGAWLKAGMNILLNLFACLLAAWLGIKLIMMKG
ncbi:fluoride efflux transporter CrcB [Lacimicrobium alkaliphilum]|uniref:Fluoride-specific ion channel FluC n=1 Tax=Lacimicrobium alkaliphilum TaxID=1526571 RepID=A0A0U3AZJ0_9ALTE|nr:fluoride efflux transporter CrcB [Lacimicrobium alkaliphilum]ALS98392.1 camphor resistance protein CrcB [Lacimicrobium alkaliphilum]